MKNAFNVAIALVETLDKLVALDFDPGKLHIVGHSMGAQIAGRVGRRVNFEIPRITGKGSMKKNQTKCLQLSYIHTV